MIIDKLEYLKYGKSNQQKELQPDSNDNEDECWFKTNDCNPMNL